MDPSLRHWPLHQDIGAYAEARGTVEMQCGGARRYIRIRDVDLAPTRAVLAAPIHRYDGSRIAFYLQHRAVRARACAAQNHSRRFDGNSRTRKPECAGGEHDGAAHAVD